VATTLAKSLVKLILRRAPGILGAWAWNGRHLSETLALRRALASGRRSHAGTLERLAAIHERRGRHERRARREQTSLNNH
jgi:HAMP domain-containing protein